MNLIKAHKFFCRKSQHYVFGGWFEHQEWTYFNKNNKWKFNWAKLSFLFRFPGAYVKFMYFTILNK